MTSSVLPVDSVSNLQLVELGLIAGSELIGLTLVEVVHAWFSSLIPLTFIVPNPSPLYSSNKTRGSKRIGLKEEEED